MEHLFAALDSTPHTEEVTVAGAGTRPVPVLGDVAAGTPIEVYVEGDLEHPDVPAEWTRGPPCSRTLTFFYKELETRGEETPDKQCARFTPSYATPRLRRGAAPE